MCNGKEPRSNRFAYKHTSMEQRLHKFTLINFRGPEHSCSSCTIFKSTICVWAEAPATFIHAYILTYLHNYIHTNMHTYKHAFIHTHIPPSRKRTHFVELKLREISYVGAEPSRHLAPKLSATVCGIEIALPISKKSKHMKKSINNRCLALNFEDVFILSCWCLFLTCIQFKGSKTKTQNYKNRQSIVEKQQKVDCCVLFIFIIINQATHDTCIIGLQ